MAGNIRFHNKFHAYTHYTDPVPGIPDSAMDPIASKEFPFLGHMYVAGCLSARGWLDDDGVCRKFLYDPEPIDCRPVKICGDHMEAALHYSHVDYYSLSSFDPLRLEIDFNIHTFKTILCDSSEYHIMPVSLSAGCVTSTRFINPSANGHVDLAFHPYLQWLNPRPCILSAGEEAILSMTSYSQSLCDVVCIWKENETDHEKPLLEYSPTITYHSEYLYYNIDTCATVLYKFILEDHVDIARLDINGHPILVCEDKGDLIWDDISMQTLTATFTGVKIPGVYELFQTFPTRAKGRNITNIRQARELLDMTNRISYNTVYSKKYNGCLYDIKYVDRGSIFFNVAGNGADIEGTKPPEKRYDLGKVIIGQSKYLLVNGDYQHDMDYYDSGYVGSTGLKKSVLNDRIWTREVYPHDPAYHPTQKRHYTLERHQTGGRSFWMLKDPYGEPLYKNFHTNYEGYENYPLQNGWEPINSKVFGTVIRAYPVKVVGQTYDGVSYSTGSRDYITDCYIPLKHSGDYYGECFTDWDTYFQPITAGTEVHVVPEDTANSDTSENVHSLIIPGGKHQVNAPTLIISQPLPGTVQAPNSRYKPGQPIRIYTKPGEKPLPERYTTLYKGPKSNTMTELAAGGTFTVTSKKFITLTGHSRAVVAISLSCYN
jgi:hypothetical protein